MKRITKSVLALLFVSVVIGTTNTVEIGGIWEVYNEGSFRQINFLKNS